MSEAQRHRKRMVKFVRRDKLVDMQVYDRKGRFVGTVRDIGFIPGENTVGLVVTTKDRKEIEVHWSEVASIEDIVLLGRDFVPSVELPGIQAETEEPKEAAPTQKQELVEVPEIPARSEHASRQEPAPRPRTKACPKCGAENDPRYKYCHKCGAKLVSA
ncbi:MAG: PRC-barrel domain-containing protein [Candidatus Brockarchaeota archaeon]|nr:PRC-barrel domain-containing protein [Candidatus Brockarchaeota archaeon]